MDEIYNLSPLGASGPTDFVHKIHVGFDPITGAFTGLPDQWNALLKGSKITPEDAAKNPQAVLEALEFYTEQNRREKQGYDSEDSEKDDDDWKYGTGNKMTSSSKAGYMHPTPSRSTPAFRHIRDPPPRPSLPKGTNEISSKKQPKSRDKGNSKEPKKDIIPTTPVRSEEPSANIPLLPQKSYNLASSVGNISNRNQKTDTKTGPNPPTPQPTLSSGSKKKRNGRQKLENSTLSSNKNMGTKKANNSIHHHRTIIQISTSQSDRKFYW
ncbi:unnamed protein product [Absidia cylindrospora]